MPQVTTKYVGGVKDGTTETSDCGKTLPVVSMIITRELPHLASVYLFDSWLTESSGELIAVMKLHDVMERSDAIAYLKSRSREFTEIPDHS